MRVFGNGACVHLHGALPYFYIDPEPALAVISSAGTQQSKGAAAEAKLETLAEAIAKVSREVYCHLYFYRSIVRQEEKQITLALTMIETPILPCVCVSVCRAVVLPFVADFESSINTYTMPSTDLEPKASAGVSNFFFFRALLRKCACQCQKTQELEEQLNLGHTISPRVHGITLASRRNFYGYDPSPKTFLQVYLYLPTDLGKAAQLLAAGAVLGVGFQASRGAFSMSRARIFASRAPPAL